METVPVYFAPAQSAIEMAEAFVKDKKRLIPCASYCEGSLELMVILLAPTVIGANGVEKIIEFDLNEDEK